MDNYLVHYGVQGQSWGNRRWQYEDGTLTPEGRRHYGYGDVRKVTSKLSKDSDYYSKRMEEARIKGDKESFAIAKKSRHDSQYDKNMIENPNQIANRARIGAGLIGVGTGRIAAAELGTYRLSAGKELVAETLLMAVGGAIGVAVGNKISKNSETKIKKKYGLNK